MSERTYINIKKMPKLLFISYDGDGSNDELYIDGELVKGARNVNIISDYGEPTIHMVEYLTAVSGES